MSRRTELDPVPVPKPAVDPHQAENRAKWAKRAQNTAKLHAEAPGDRIDPLAPDAMKLLFVKAFRRMENMLAAPMTDQDITGAFNATRLAAGVGKQPEQAKAFSIDMTSNLGVDVPEDDEGK